MLLHASCVSVNGKGVLLAGPPGIGKSDLALRLIDGGATLVADDQVLLSVDDGTLMAAQPEPIAGLMEIRHVGLLRLPHAPMPVAVALYVELTAPGAPLERLPDPEAVFLLDRPVQRLRLPATAASTPAKIRAFLAYPVVND